ncbi:MAG: hypothetical protein DBY35_13690 [Bacteroidales bacterium]|nr:MAG: hypothetical protein DBY35_13690 [Bacteroidales bacterium]
MYDFKLVNANIRKNIDLICRIQKNICNFALAKQRLCYPVLHNYKRDNRFSVKNTMLDENYGQKIWIEQN